MKCYICNKNLPRVMFTNIIDIYSIINPSECICDNCLSETVLDTVENNDFLSTWEMENQD